ncbi:MAG: twin-arginine translocase TatA/TatE family subunit [Candidatus Omnitrophica bacterium]|nr:twin-arginine translocase TatA/TatE family subunit [Candidatus Omnitrophota bacterium]
MGRFGIGEIALILVILVIIFGRKLPEIARSLGESIKEFKKSINKDDKSGQGRKDP